MLRVIPSAHSARHVAAAEAIDLDGDDISDAALSIPPHLLALALSVVHQAHARSVVAATVRGDFEHDPADDCGCDRCAATRAELNERYDAMASAIDDGALAWELDRATPHAGLYGAARLYRGWYGGAPSNSSIDPAEVA